MADAKLTQFKVLQFDVYGTLIDWETGIYTALQPLLERANKQWSKKDALVAFKSVEKDLQVQYPTMIYADLLAKAHAELESRLFGEGSWASATAAQGGSTSAVGADPSTSASGAEASASSSDKTSEHSVNPREQEHIAFGQSIKDWPVFPDTVSALSTLSKSYELVVLSNVDRTSFAFTRAALEKPGHFTFSHVITAQDVGSYKPSDANFEHALKDIRDKFGVGRDEVLVVAHSLYHDHIPANRLGIASCWISRPGSVMGTDVKANYAFEFKTLGDMADAVVRENTKA